MFLLLQGRRPSGDLKSCESEGRPQPASLDEIEVDEVVLASKVIGRWEVPVRGDAR